MVVLGATPGGWEFGCARRQAAAGETAVRKCPNEVVEFASKLASGNGTDTLFSVSTPSQNPLERLPAELLKRAKSIGVTLGAQASDEQRILPFGWGPLSPEHGLLRGQVTELCVGSAGGLATSLALGACAQAQQMGGKGFGSDDAHWCAFIDPAGALYAPGVVARGVRLDRLLVLRPPLEALGRIAVKVARSQVFGLLVVDTCGVQGQTLGVDLGVWVRLVRQMTLALEGSESSILLITSELSRRPIPLPVARRIDLVRVKPDVLRFRIARDRARPPEPWRHLTYSVTSFDEPIRHAG